MYGEGNSAKLLQDIVNGTTQVTEGISHSMGIDFKSLVAGMVGGKLMADGSKAPQVIVQTGEKKTAPAGALSETSAQYQGRSDITGESDNHGKEK